MIRNGMDIRCATCAFWSENPRPETTDGQCRAKPPVVMRTDRGLRAVWPMTEGNWWCGGHVPQDA